MKKQNIITNTSVCRCMFIQCSGMVYSALYSEGKMETLYFGGEKSVGFDENFWNRWIQTVSFETTQTIDACIISDDSDFTLPKILEQISCPAEKSVWNEQLVAKAIEEIRPEFPARIFTEKEVLIYDYMTYFPDREPIPLVAKFANVDLCTHTTAASQKELVAVGTGLSKNKSGQYVSENVSELARYYIREMNKDKEKGIR